MQSPNERPTNTRGPDRPLPLHDRYALALGPAIIQTEQHNDEELASRIFDLVEVMLRVRSQRCAESARRRTAQFGLPEDDDAR